MKKVDIQKLLKDPNLFKEDAYINGQWIKESSGNTFAITNPATNELLAQVSNLGSKEAKQAISAADQALPEWRAKTGKDRAKILRKWFDLIIANTEDLATIMTLEQGKPLSEASGEVIYGASFVEWFAEEAKRVSGAILSTTSNDRRLMVLKQAIGVCIAYALQ